LEAVRSTLNIAGVERRRRIVKWCCEVSEHLDLVPEAAPLRPKLEAYVDGGDPEHFGDVLAELLKAWASSSSPEMVQLSLSMHHEGIEAIMKQTFKALHRCKGEWKGKGKGKCGWKGKGGKREGECHGWERMGDWWRSKGEWWVAKAMGKGMGAGPVWPPSTALAAGPAVCPMEGPASAAAAPEMPSTLRDEVASKAPGVPRNMSLVAAVSPETSEEEPKVQTVLASSAPLHVEPEAPENIALKAMALERDDLSSKVGLLLEMGLVSDPGVGLDLLSAQDGDINQVVAMISG